MEKRYRLLLFLILLAGENAFSQQFADMNFPEYNLYSVSFSDSLNGWIGGYPSLLMHTTDGGLSWTKDSLSFTSSRLTFFSWVKMRSSQNVWLVWDDVYSRVGRQNNIRTKWDTLLIGDDFGHICTSGWTMTASLDTSLVWVCGWSNDICGSPLPFLKSRDGGKTWQDAGLHPQNYIGPGGDNYFTDLEVTNKYVFVLTSGTIINRASVDSTLWQADTLSNVSRYLSDLSFGGLNSGWACGQNGNLFCTTNAGDSWLPQHINTAQNLVAISAIDSEYAWTIGDSGAIFRTTNGGVSWDSVLSVHKKPEALSFPDRNHGWIVGDSGLLVQYNNGVISSVRTTNVLPTSFILFQNYPNPFNPSTMVGFELSHSEFVTLKIFNILGQEIATLVAGELVAGQYTKQWDASAFASGVYFYQLRAGGTVQTKKLILLR